MGALFNYRFALPDSGEGLEGVVVTLTDSDGLTTATTTDENGNYAFRNLSARNYTFEISVDGEKKRQVEIVVPSPNYDFEL